MAYRSGCHTTFHHRYHLVWAPKYRYKVLIGDVRLRVREIIRQVCDEMGVTIVNGALSRDHVHMFVEIPPHVSVSDFVRRAKGRSSRKIQQEFEHIRKRYWGQRSSRRRTIDTLSYGMLLAAAGHDTTSSSVGVGMMQLARHPEEFAKLKADPSLIPAAAQEIFRWATPVRHFMRTAAVDTELAGQEIKAGESVCLMYLSGNRDEEAFPEADRFCVDRSPNRHVAFGFGAHHCLGRILAEMELEALLQEIVARVEHVELAGDPEWVKTNHTGGLKHLPIRYQIKSN